MNRFCMPEQHIALMAIVLLGMHLAFCPRSFGLDPRLDVTQYAHQNWKVRDGFFKSQVSSIAQTPDGYLWLATDFGLVRFDGKKFTPWQPPAGQHLPSVSILRLLAARDGTLWIGATKGLASWKDGKLTQYPELAGKYIFALLEDHEGSVWASGVTVSTGKLCAMRNGSAQCYGDDGSLGHGAGNLYEDSKGNLWAGVAAGLWRWRPDPPKFFPLEGETDGIQALGEDADGALLVGWRGDLKRILNGKIQEYLLPGFTQQFKAKRIVRDHEGGVWIGTNGQGLVHLHQGRTDVFRQSDGLSGDFVSAMFEDHEGNLWVATLDGLDRFRNFIVPTFSVRQGLSNSVVFSVLADKNGDVWFGTAGGLDKWHNGKITTYDKRQGKLNGRPPNSLFQDSQGRIWVSTQEGFGYLENDRWNPIRAITGGPVLSIAQDRAGSLWLANEKFGLFELLGTNVVRHMLWEKMGHKDHASVLAADPSQGGLWIGFFMGGIAYIKDGQIRASFSVADGLGEGSVSGFQFDDDGSLWISTEGGLSRLQDGRLITLTEKNGLPCNAVNWIIEGDARSLWLYTQCGLVRIDRKELDSWVSGVQNNHTIPAIQPTVFDSFDGVRSLAAGGHLSPQVAKSADGKLWFLPWDGVSVIDPRHLPINNLLPPVNIEQVAVDGKSFDATAAAHGVMRLPPLVRNLQIDYTALSFVAPEKVLFRYKLEGFDKDWREAGTRRQMFYNNLSPGNYRFQVAACNNSGVWNQDGATLDFSIAPAYYQTAWFRVLCVAVVVAFIWSLFQFRQRQMQQQFNMRLDARVNERTRIARELHDTLLQSFHGLLFRFQAARNMLPRRTEEAIQALDGAILRAEEAMGESRSAIRDLRSEAAQADLPQSFTAIGQELASQNADHEPPLFQVIVEGEQRKLSHAFQSEANQIGRELLQNAFRHARAREIEAEIRYDRRMFRLLIRDDGRGIDPNVLEQGGRPGHWGLPGIRERAKQIGAQLDFWSEVGAGTEIQLTVPAKIAYEEFQDGSKFRLFRKAKREDS